MKSAYMLACGYVDTKTCGDCFVTLWKEHGKYHVRAFDYTTRKNQFWDVFDTLKEAQRRYRRPNQ